MFAHKLIACRGSGVVGRVGSHAHLGCRTSAMTRTLAAPAVAHVHHHHPCALRTRGLHAGHIENAQAAAALLLHVSYSCSYCCTCTCHVVVVVYAQNTIVVARALSIVITCVLEVANVC